VLWTHREAVLEHSQGYAFLANPWKENEIDRRTPEDARNPRHPFRVRSYLRDTHQVYAKNAYTWLISHHASGVNGLAHFGNEATLPRGCKGATLYRRQKSDDLA